MLRYSWTSVGVRRTSASNSGQFSRGSGLAAGGKTRAADRLSRCARRSNLPAPGKCKEGKTMVSLTRWAAVSGLVLGLVLSVNSLNASTMNRTEYLKFNAPVALPGVTLSPGTYSFELADSSNPSLVIVRDRNTRQPKFLGFTYRVPRPASARDMK